LDTLLVSSLVIITVFQLFILSCEQTDGRTDRRTEPQMVADSPSHVKLVGAYARGPARTLTLGPSFIHAAAAAENQCIGKTRRRSIYSTDTVRQTCDTTYHQPTSQPK